MRNPVETGLRISFFFEDEGVHDEFIRIDCKPANLRKKITHLDFNLHQQEENQKHDCKETISNRPKYDNILKASFCA